jgi:DNA repair exonuclease SbcCD ATPase subunit
MNNSQQEQERAELHVSNIGGISQTTVDISPGVTVLAGRNATNRTSLLQGLIAGLGGDDVTLNSEATEGSVELEIDGETYTRTLRRKDGTVVTGGDPYLEDPTVVELFATLLEWNEARQAVAQGEDLRDIIMRPIDTGEINAQISQLQTDRDQIESEIADITELQRRLPDLESRSSELEAELSDKREELAQIEADIRSHDADIKSQDDHTENLEAKLGELGDTRNELEQARQELETQRSSIDALEEQHDELTADLDDHQSIPAGRLEEIDDDLRRLRSERADLEDAIDQLQTVIQFNQDVLQGGSDVFADLHGENGSGDEVTDRLLNGGEDDSLTCWTCGTDITADQIEGMLERLREAHKAKLSDRSSLEEEISDLQDERSQLKKRRRRQEKRRSRLADIESELEERRDRVADLESRRDELRDTVERLESEAEKLRSDDDQSELIQLHKEANELEVATKRLEDNLEDVTAEITRIEDRVAERDQLEAQQEELTAEIKRLRTRITRLEENAVDRFNTHMETVLDLLGYDNLTRVWLERTETEQAQGSRGETTSGFDLHIVRETSEGTVYEDTIQHLSESEREVVGLVFALAGYLVHDLHETCPFLLLDSIEAIDPQRIEALVEYFAEYPTYLVVALLEDDARHLSEEYQRITDI